MSLLARSSHPLLPPPLPLSEYSFSLRFHSFLSYSSVLFSDCCSFGSLSCERDSESAAHLEERSELTFAAYDAQDKADWLADIDECISSLLNSQRSRLGKFLSPLLLQRSARLSALSFGLPTYSLYILALSFSLSHLLLSHVSFQALFQRKRRTSRQI
jgi:hypothetical protein